MISTSVIPISTATQQQLVIEAKETVYRPYCIDSTIRPSATISFTKGAVAVVGTTAIVPITATITVSTPAMNGRGQTNTQVFTEKFEVGFTATSANTVTLTPSTDVIVVPSNTHCCKSKTVKVTTTLTVVIA